MVTVILNHAAGTKRDDDVRTRLADLFHAGRLPVEIIACEAGAAAGAALSAAKSGAEAVVAAGGDGTVSAVASALADSRTPLGVLPSARSIISRRTRDPLDPERR